MVPHVLSYNIVSGHVVISSAGERDKFSESPGSQKGTMSLGPLREGTWLSVVPKKFPCKSHTFSEDLAPMSVIA